MQFFGLELAADIGMALNFANLATFPPKNIILVLSFHFLEGSNHPLDPRISKNGSGSDRV